MFKKISKDDTNFEVKLSDVVYFEFDLNLHAHPVLLKHSSSNMLEDEGVTLVTETPSQGERILTKMSFGANTD